MRYTNRVISVLWAISYLVSIGFIHTVFARGAAGMATGALLLAYWCILGFFTAASVFALFHWKLRKSVLRSILFSALIVIVGVLLTLGIWPILEAIWPDPVGEISIHTPNYFGYTLRGFVVMMIFFPFLSLLNAGVILKAGFSVPALFYGPLLVLYWGTIAMWLWPR